MSNWSYVSGTIVVSPLGRTQAEKRYILETVLDHLPRVTGSEKDMDVYIIQKKGFNTLSSHTEFGVYAKYLERETLSTKQQDQYILVVDGALRDKTFDKTFKEFQKWICRLAKRVCVENVLVKIEDLEKETIIENVWLSKEVICDTVYGQMFEVPTWVKRKEEVGEPSWAEYLMYDTARDSMYPMLLGYKYFSDEENDKEAERRIRYGKGY